MKNFGSFDYIIVGGGSAACVLANRLTQDPDVSVLLLEAGGKDSWIWIHIPADAPRIAPCYLSTADDRKVAADALRLTRHIVSMPALAPYGPVEYLPGPQYQTDDELAVAAGMVGTTIFHPIGTCRMGRADDADAVVDARLRVRGVSGLRVIDASIMPTITSGNTNAPTMMIAEKGAQMIRADRRNEPAVVISTSGHVEHRIFTDVA